MFQICLVKADNILWWAVLRSARPVPDPVGIFFHQVLHFNSPFLEIVIRLKKKKKRCYGEKNIDRIKSTAFDRH